MNYYKYAAMMVSLSAFVAIVTAVEAPRKPKKEYINRSVIREQVEMGVAVRMACLDALTRHLPETAP